MYPQMKITKSLVRRSIQRSIFVGGACFCALTTMLWALSWTRNQNRDGVRSIHPPRRDAQLQEEDVWQHSEAVRKSTAISSPINPHNFAYVINPTETCVNRDVFLLALVLSAPSNTDRRAVIRETWGDRRNFAEIAVRVVFLLGATGDGSVQKALVDESNAHGDIVQEDFVDSYRNLTHKVIMGLKWATIYCAHARFLAKIDDDISVNVFNLVEILRRKRNEKLLLCHRYPSKRVWRKAGVYKWVVTHDDYPNDTFPRYCMGWAYLLTPDVAGALYNASLNVPYFWIEDIYVTGVLAQAVEVIHEEFSPVFYYVNRYFQQSMELSDWRTRIFGQSSNVTEQRAIWNYVLAEQRSSSREKLNPH